jgi:uncharacterized BrkB/YihY/UPF0761 family membrane protein
MYIHITMHLMHLVDVRIFCVTLTQLHQPLFSCTQRCLTEGQERKRNTMKAALAYYFLVSTPELSLIHVSLGTADSV